MTDSSHHLRITINGVEYASLDEVPEPYRSMLVDHDGDGIPDDIDLHDLDGEVSIESTITHTTTTSTTSALDMGPVGDRLQQIPSVFRCRRCGYDLRKSTLESTCPECGLSVAASVIDMRSRIHDPELESTWKNIKRVVLPVLFLFLILVVILLMM